MGATGGGKRRGVAEPSVPSRSRADEDLPTFERLGDERAVGTAPPKRSQSDRTTESFSLTSSTVAWSVVRSSIVPTTPSATSFMPSSTPLSEWSMTSSLPSPVVDRRTSVPTWSCTDVSLRSASSPRVLLLAAWAVSSWMTAVRSADAVVAGGGVTPAVPTSAGVVAPCKSAVSNSSDWRGVCTSSYCSCTAAWRAAPLPLPTAVTAAAGGTLRRWICEAERDGLRSDSSKSWT